MQLADLEVVGIIVVAVAVPVGICVLVVWLNMKQQGDDRAAVRGQIERERGPGVEIKSIQAGKSDVSLVYTHGIGGRFYRVTLVTGPGDLPVKELWKIDHGQCSKVE
jgi:hypothetical protein